jgi:hypothetical protein
MSSAFPDARQLAGNPAAAPCAVRRPRISEWIGRALASTAATWLPELRAQWPAEGSTRGAQAPTKTGDSRAVRQFPYPGRVPSDVLAGQPAVVIPLNRAVVCGEDHVYDVGQFNVCPNCAAEERLPLIELLAHERKTLIAVER